MRSSGGVVGAGGSVSAGSLSDHPSLSRTVRSRLSHAFARFTTPLHDTNQQGGGEKGTHWEYHTFTLARVSGYGFGLAVSGGRDNPHFPGGDPAIAISDVLKAGPAEGKLHINDRLVSANGISLENVEYPRAVQVLRECGNSVRLVIKRQTTSSNCSPNSQSVKVTLTKGRKKDDFGIVLGCRIYVKEITNHSGVEKDGALHEGDIILKINSNSTDSMTLKEARKIIENTKEKLQLVLKRESLDNINGPQQQTPNGDVKIPPPSHDRSDEKNNVTRLQSGRNRGPIMDISLSQLDQPATPVLAGHVHNRSQDEESPLHRPPPLPRIDEFSIRRDQFDDDPLARRNKSNQGEVRAISFQKEGSVGVRLTGGNLSGVFVTAVQPGSPASLQGLQPGDKLLKVNEHDMKGVTREEAVLLLLQIQDYVHLIVQHSKDEYDEIVANQRGDSFYVRTHFSYEGGGNGGELGFKGGEVFHVVDTLHTGTVGSWVVFRLSRTNQEVQKGVIPNATRAEQWAAEQQEQAKKDAASESRGSFFKRRSARRSKSLSKDHWEDVVFADGISKFPAYERVTLKHPGFIRPVVMFGALADIARDKLLKDYPDKYGSPQLDGQLDDIPKSQKSSGIIRLSAIKEIIEKGKHAILDITPSAVDRLNYAQFHPVVVFLRAESKASVKEMRSRVLPRNGHHKSSKKLHDQAVKLEKLWSQVFTATITLSSADMWYKKLRETVDKQQQQSIWISESKPDGAISDDFLFPMTSRLSYASSPESDMEGGVGVPRASSDPSIATQDDAPPPAYHPPPPRSRQMPFDFLQQQDSLPPQMDVRDSLSTPKYNPGMDIQKSVRSEVGPVGPPRVDRGNKPTHYRTPQERLLAQRHSLLLEVARDHREPPDYINTGAQPHSLDRPNGRLTGFDSSSYSSDSYNQYSGTPGDKNPYHSRPAHDPYRYARTQPQPPLPVDQRRAPPPSKYRPDERPSPPSPPPKPTNYQHRMNDGRPVPPPKPGHYQSSRGGWPPEDTLEPPPYSAPGPRQGMRNSMDFAPPPPHYTPPRGVYDESGRSPLKGDEGGFDSGRGSSLDRNYEVHNRSYSKGGQQQWGMNGPPYHNVPYPPRGGRRGEWPPPYDHPPPAPPSGLIDLSNRENRGSAFELYKKPALQPLAK